MQNIYLYFPDNKELHGKATAKEAGKGATELLGFSTGVSMPLSGSSASGQARHHGRANLSDFTISKYLDDISPHLSQFCAGGNILKKSEIHLYHAHEKAEGSKPVLYAEYHLHDVIVTSVSVGGGGHDLPVETVTMNFSKIEWHHSKMDNKTGEGKGKISTSWDTFANTK